MEEHADDGEPSASRQYRPRDWIGTLLGGLVALSGGVTGCLVIVLLLLAPLLIFVLVFSQGLVSIFER